MKSNISMTVISVYGRFTVSLYASCARLIKASCFVTIAAGLKVRCDPFISSVKESIPYKPTSVERYIFPAAMVQVTVAVAIAVGSVKSVIAAVFARLPKVTPSV
jgi:hypothetical protein